MSTSSPINLSHKAMAAPFPFCATLGGCPPRGQDPNPQRQHITYLSPMPLTLSALHVYPVKGLKGIDLDAARCTDRGLENDRRWLVVDEHADFLSQREVPKMAT